MNKARSKPRTSPRRLVRFSLAHDRAHGNFPPPNTRPGFNFRSRGPANARYARYARYVTKPR